MTTPPKNRHPVKLLPSRFYSRSPEIVARALLGKLLIRGLHGERLTGRITEVEAYLGLIDPASLSRDPNTSVEISDISQDGQMVAYALKQGGADEDSIQFLNVKTKKKLEDELPSARYMSIQFAPDGRSVYYAHNDKSGTLLYQHVLGTRNSRDVLIFGREFRGEPLGGNDLFSAIITDDNKYLVIQIDRGVP
ncbi:MAG: DNA-3-methyladenine glycosylase, partial [Edaphobacter sp.]